MPESFIKVTMLYVNLKINNHPIKAFIDSGAQSTIMSKDCAEKCGLTRLIDTRFAGVAQGVGTCKILGKIHKVSLSIGNEHLLCSLTIIE